MPENLKDILSGLSSEVDQETLLRYLQGKLSGPQQHEIEKQLMQDEFNEDAAEGLEQFRDKEQLQYMVEMLNRDLKKKTEKKKKRRERLRLKEQPWILISILILLLLIVLSYMVIRKLMTP
ncbi:MAG: hypothetical protein ACO25B_09570 [Chitinophagaceae bacterium]